MPTPAAMDSLLGRRRAQWCENRILQLTQSAVVRQYEAAGWSLGVVDCSRVPRFSAGLIYHDAAFHFGHN